MKKTIIYIVIGAIIFGGIGGGLYFLQKSREKSKSTEPPRVQVIQPTGETKEFHVRSFNFGFEPSTIEVNAGDKVRIILTSDDVPHGLAINEFVGVNKRVDPSPAEPTVIEFLADKRGEFTFYCSVPCGDGHLDMKGKLIVK